jgi:hypothetical protein
MDYSKERRRSVVIGESELNSLLLYPKLRVLVNHN